jgi:1,4-dihydroxy-2-naphthoate octaprenyltransferase
MIEPRAAPTATAALGPPGRLRVWLQAVRLFSFTASIIPIVVAIALALADGAFASGGPRPYLLAAAMLVASVACHAGANLANDYHDHRRGLDTAASLGPSKVIQQGLLSPAAVRRGMIVAFAVATAIGLAIVAATGWPVLVLALLSLGAAYLYTGGPKPLGYVALGELTVFLAMGPGMIAGAYYVLTGRVTPAAIVASLPVACLVAAILHANNIRDLEPDRTAGKVTLATWLGRRAANVEYALLVGATYPLVLALIAIVPRLWPVALTLLSLPTALDLIRRVFAAEDEMALNVVLRKTAGLHLRFGLLFSAGLVIGAVLGWPR